MFTKKMFTIFAIALFSFIYATSDINAQEQKTIKIDPLKKSIDTGVKMELGDIVEVIEVKGQIWVNGPGGGGGGKSLTGSPGTPNIPGHQNSYQYSKATPHSLVAYVGNPGNHYQVRKSIFQAASNAGNLFFGFNDNADNYGDNKGGWDVTYRIVKKAKICTFNSGPQLTINWTNKSGADVTVNWINDKCVENQPGQLLKSNDSFGLKTSVGHIFRIRDAKTKEEIGLITVEATSTQVDIFAKQK